ncbi:MAG: sialidase family protein [Phycisphaerae bacterium]
MVMKRGHVNHCLFFVSHEVSATKAGRWNWLWLGVIAGCIGASAPPVRAQFGVAITPPVALNTNADSDSGDDFNSQLTTDGSGNWVAVWTSDENLGGTIGADEDILTARSTDNGATWTAPAPLNSNAAADSENDFFSACHHRRLGQLGGGVAVHRDPRRDDWNGPRHPRGPQHGQWGDLDHPGAAEQQRGGGQRE